MTNWTRRPSILLILAGLAGLGGLMAPIAPIYTTSTYLTTSIRTHYQLSSFATTVPWTSTIDCNNPAWKLTCLSIEIWKNVLFGTLTQYMVGGPFDPITNTAYTLAIAITDTSTIVNVLTLSIETSTSYKSLGNDQTISIALVLLLAGAICIALQCISKVMRKESKKKES